MCWVLRVLTVRESQLDCWLEASVSTLSQLVFSVSVCIDTTVTRHSQYIDTVTETRAGFWSINHVGRIFRQEAANREVVAVGCKTLSCDRWKLDVAVTNCIIVLCAPLPVGNFYILYLHTSTIKSAINNIYGSNIYILLAKQVVTVTISVLSQFF